MNLEDLQLLGQLIDSMEFAIQKMEKSYENKNSEEFFNSKKTILEFQKQILEQIKK